MRVGDEYEVELLPGRLPIATSAAAVVKGRIVEVENAANNAGNAVRIRILDVDDDDDYVLAELVTAGARCREEAPSRRSSGAKPLTAAEQTKQLRELAEEAAHQAPSTSADRDLHRHRRGRGARQDVDRRALGEEQADAIIIAKAKVSGSTRGRRRSAQAPPAPARRAAAAGARRVRRDPSRRRPNRRSSKKTTPSKRMSPSRQPVRPAVVTAAGGIVAGVAAG